MAYTPGVSTVVDEKDLNKPHLVRSEKAEEAEKQTEDVKYTLFVSGLNYGGRNIEMKDKNFTNDIAIIFDQIENYTFDQNIDKSQFAVEDRVTISDHAVIKDGVFSFTGRVNTSPHIIYEQNYIDRNTDPERPADSARPEAALEAMMEIIKKRQLVTLVTEETILENYIVTKCSAKKSTGEGAALVFDVELTEFRTFVLNKMVNATAYTNPKKIDKPKQKGAVNNCQANSNVENKAKGSGGRYADGTGMNAVELQQQDEARMVTLPNGRQVSQAELKRIKRGESTSLAQVPSETGNYDAVHGKDGRQ